MQEEDPYTFHSDVYALGVVLFEMITGKLPYGENLQRDMILWLVGKGRLRPVVSDSIPARENCPRALLRLQEKCVAFERDQRPPVPMVLSHFSFESPYLLEFLLLSHICL